VDKKERKTLRQIYAHPGRDGDALDRRRTSLHRIGGYARWSGKHHLTVELKGHKASFSIPEDKSSRLDAWDGSRVREFLTSAGVTADVADG
jgi:hypothetical protein